jgi:porin
VGNIFTVSNAAAFNSLYLYELWFQQELWEGAVSLRVGQLAADAEFANSDYGSLFLNATFGWPTFLANNIPNVGPAYPKGAPGVRLALQPASWLTVQAAVYQGDAFADASNRHGVSWDLQRQSGYLWMGELQGRWCEHAESRGLPGAAKAGFWLHSGDFAAADSSSDTVHPGNGGIYAVVDQRVWRPDGDGDPDRGVGWFGRVAAGPQDRNFIGFYFDGGITCQGLVPSRDADTFGIAFAFGRPTADARRALEAGGGTPAAAEMVLEATYQCELTPWLSVQPDLQFVINPGAVTDLRNALVAGVRVSVVF